MAEVLVWAIPIFPLIAAVLVSLLAIGNATRAGHMLTLSALAVSAAATVAWVVFMTDATAQVFPGYTWLHLGSLAIDISLRVDPLSTFLLLVVTGISFLVACYSVGYMAHDPGFTRYFAIFAAFVFCMTMLVLSNNLLCLYAFWEGVGVCSYLLIGFWHQRPTAAAAATKAFLVNRIADCGFLIGILLLWNAMGSFTASPTSAWSRLDFNNIFEMAKPLVESQPGLATLIGFLLLLGAIGKSAQFPLHVWLPDAMEGPTPVSALIHAATMVTAGVYLLARMSPLLVLTPAVLVTAAVLGAITALLGASIAVYQHDLKKVLAYSTVSQLGYMFMAIGCGSSPSHTILAVTAGMFHLLTHAFFKALLFLSAGNVMHAMGDVIDMRRFSGLRQILPWTNILFLIGGCALAGLPPLAGFWSKDEILSLIHQSAEGPNRSIYLAIVACAWLTAFLTAFYIFRAYFRTFGGAVRLPEEAGEHPHEASAGMLAPLIVLAIGSLIAGVALGPTGIAASLLGHEMEDHHAANHGSNTIFIASSLVAFAGLTVAWIAARFDATRPLLGLGSLQRAGESRFYLDEIFRSLIVSPLMLCARAVAWVDRHLVDGVVRGVAFLPSIVGMITRRQQNGDTSSYAFVMAIGLVAFLTWTLFR